MQTTCLARVDYQHAVQDLKCSAALRMSVSKIPCQKNASTSSKRQESSQQKNAWVWRSSCVFCVMVLGVCVLCLCVACACVCDVCAVVFCTVTVCGVFVCCWCLCVVTVRSVCVCVWFVCGVCGVSVWCLCGVCVCAVFCLRNNNNNHVRSNNPQNQTALQ